MPSISVILNACPTACILAGNDIAKSSLYGNTLDNDLAKKIYAVYFVVNKIYTEDSNFVGLTGAANYLWELMGKYGIMAMDYQGDSTGGTIIPVPSPFSTSKYPIVVTGANFASDGITYNNTNIVGDNLMIRISGYNQEWHFAPTDFEYTATGIRITIPNFNANNFPNIIIQNFTIN